MRKFNVNEIQANINSNVDRKLQDELKKHRFLAIEIGAGTGLHSINYAKENSTRFLVAIEKTHTRFRKFEKGAALENIPNLLPVHDHAVSWAANYLDQKMVDEFILMYPNPNPKPKDLNKRWHAMPFFGFMIDCLKAGGRIVMRTNEKFYADEAAHFMGEEWKLQTTVNKIFPSSLPNHKTLFEKKYLERGQTCYEIIGVLQ